MCAMLRWPTCRMNFARAQQDLQRQSGTLDERSIAHMAVLERISADLEKTRRASSVGSDVLKVSDERCKLFCVQRGSRALPPWQWSTTCWVRFGFWACTSNPSSTSFPLDSLSSRCFGEVSNDCLRRPQVLTRFATKEGPLFEWPRWLPLAWAHSYPGDGARSASSRLESGLDGLGGAHLLFKCDCSPHEEDPREERARGPSLCIFLRSFCQHSGFDSSVRSHKT